MGNSEDTGDLGRLLVEEGLITEGHLQAARQAQATQEKSLGRVLVDMGLLTEEAKMAFLHKRLDYEIVDISEMVVPKEILTRISRSYVEKHRCVPILEEDNHLVLAMEDPTDIVVLDEVERQAGVKVMPVLAPLEDIEGVIAQYPKLSQEQADHIRARIQRSLAWRILHPLLFLVVMLLPLVGFGLAARFSPSFSNVVLHYGSALDIALYGILGWILWALIVWEIDALFFTNE